MGAGIMGCRLVTEIDLFINACFSYGCLANSSLESMLRLSELCKVGGVMASLVKRLRTKCSGNKKHDARNCSRSAEDKGHSYGNFSAF